MNDSEALDEIPAVFLDRFPGAGFIGTKLRDDQFVLQGKRKEAMRSEVDSVISSLKRQMPVRKF
jgi:hypothetical protein